MIQAKLESGGKLPTGESGSGSGDWDQEFHIHLIMMANGIVYQVYDL